MNPKFDRMRPKSSEPGRPVKRSKPMGKNLLVNGVGRHTDVFSADAVAAWRAPIFTEFRGGGPEK
jgi:hypothetical protein